MALEFLFDNFEKNCYTIIKEGDKVKYCVTARQPYSVLKKADEVIVDTIDRDIINDFIEKIPDKRIILSGIGPIQLLLIMNYKICLL